jgi:hypothetical protein
MAGSMTRTGPRGKARMEAAMERSLYNRHHRVSNTSEACFYPGPAFQPNRCPNRCCYIKTPELNHGTPSQKPFSQLSHLLPARPDIARNILSRRTVYFSKNLIAWQCWEPRQTRSGTSPLGSVPQSEMPRPLDGMTHGISLRCMVLARLKGS